MQVENPQISESGFTLDRIMHLHINFHQLLLMLGSSYIELPKWIAKEKAVINKKKTMSSALNGLLLHYSIMKTLHIIPKELAYPSIMKSWTSIMTQSART